MPLPPIRKILLGSLLIAAPLAAAGCPGPSKDTTTQPASSTTGTSAKESQTQALQNDVAAFQSTIQGLVDSYTSLANSYTQATTTPTQNLYAVQSLYRTLGTVATDGTTTNWDDVTKQVTEISNASASVTLGVTGQNASERTATINLTRSPDGTVGSLTIDATSPKWNDLNSSASYQVWYNQVPDLNALTAASCKLDLTPQGDSAKHLSLEVGASEIAASNLAPPFERMPSHGYFKGAVPRLTFDQTVDLKFAGSTQLDLLLAGTLGLTTSTGIQNWTESVDYHSDLADATASALTFDLENTTHKFKLVGSAGLKTKDTADGTKTNMAMKGTITSLIDGSQLGTLSYDANTDQVPYLTLANGTKIDLKLKPGS